MKNSGIAAFNRFWNYNTTESACQGYVFMHGSNPPPHPPTSAFSSKLALAEAFSSALF